MKSVYTACFLCFVTGSAFSLTVSEPISPHTQTTIRQKAPTPASDVFNTGTSVTVLRTDLYPIGIYHLGTFENDCTLKENWEKLGELGEKTTSSRGMLLDVQVAGQSIYVLRTDAEYQPILDRYSAVTFALDASTSVATQFGPLSRLAVFDDQIIVFGPSNEDAAVLEAYDLSLTRSWQIPINMQNNTSRFSDITRVDRNLYGVGSTMSLDTRSGKTIHEKNFIARINSSNGEVEAVAYYPGDSAPYFPPSLVYHSASQKLVVLNDNDSDNAVFDIRIRTFSTMLLSDPPVKVGTEPYRPDIPLASTSKMFVANDGTVLLLVGIPVAFHTLATFNINENKVSLMPLDITNLVTRPMNLNRIQGNYVLSYDTVSSSGLTANYRAVCVGGR